MTLLEITRRMEERSRLLSLPLSKAQAQALREEGERLESALREERERLRRDWLASADESEWARSAQAGVTLNPARVLGRG